jgi:tRNA G18 (ribose-2'-O)-methylase SpoU
MAIQLSHNSPSLRTEKKSLIIICDHMESPANVGGLFRLCDALGIQAIYFCGNMPDLTSVRLKRTSRNTHKHIEHQYFENTLDAITFCKKKKYAVIALELTSTSDVLNSFSNLEGETIALVLGNERHGISEEVLKNISIHMHIEMCGTNSSMNVIQAAAIACYSLTK